MTDTLAKLRAIYTSGDRNVMEIGWLCADLLNQMIAEEKAAGDDNPAIRPIITDLLDKLCGNSKTGELEEFYPNRDAARSSIGDRLKVMRHFTREMVAELPGKFGFNHLRRCFVMGEWPNADAEKTQERITWALQNAVKGKWPTPEQIGAAFSQPVDERQNVIEGAIKACRRVTELSDVDEIFYRMCLMVSKYRAGNGWAYDEQQAEMELKA